MSWLAESVAFAIWTGVVLLIEHLLVRKPQPWLMASALAVGWFGTDLVRWWLKGAK